MSMIIKYAVFLYLVFLTGYQAQAQDQTSGIVMIISGGQDMVYNPPVTHSCMVLHSDGSHCQRVGNEWVHQKLDTIPPTYQVHADGTRYQLHVGLVGNFFFYDSVGPSAAGGGGSIVATYSNDKHFWAQGQGGYAYLFRDEGDQRILQFSGAVGYADGPFAVGVDVGNIQFLDGPDKSAMSIGLVGQFAVPVGKNLCVLAGMRAGILVKIQSTYYQGAYLGVQHRL